MGEITNLTKKSNRVAALDGLRFWAITLVIASHTGVLSQGGLGNDIFFALSGFLSIAPFVENYENRYLSIKQIGNYYFGRFFRIMPTCWCCLLYVTLLIKDCFYVRDLSSDSSLLLNMFFIKSKGHLWFLQQEMMFYLVAPVIFVILALIKKFIGKFVKNQAKTDLALFVIVTVLAFVARKYLTPQVIHLRGNGGEQSFRLCYFLMGMSFSYLYRVYREFDLKFFEKKIGTVISNITIFLFLTFCIASSCFFLQRFDENLAQYYIGWALPTVCVYITCVVIFSILVSPNCFMCKVLGNKVFEKIGSVSFIMYLIHFFFINRLVGRNQIFTFILIYSVSFALALLIHVLVEKPSIIFSKKKSFRELKQYYKDLMVN